MSIPLEVFRSYMDQPLKQVYEDPHRATSRLCLEVIFSLAETYQPRRVLELYMHRGDTTKSLCRALPRAEVFTGDICRESGIRSAHPISDSCILPRDQVGGTVAAAGLKNVHFMIEESNEALNDWFRHEAKRGGGFDFIFIDGDHTWRGVERDTRLAVELCTPGAVLVWHDYQGGFPDVLRYLNGLNAVFGGRVVYVEGTALCFLKLNTVRRGLLLAALERVEPGQATPVVTSRRVSRTGVTIPGDPARYLPAKYQRQRGWR